MTAPVRHNDAPAHRRLLANEINLIIAGETRSRTSGSVTTSPYTVGDSGVVLVDDDAIGGVATINLDPTNDGIFHIKKMGTTANVIVVGTIDGTTNFTITSQYESITVALYGAGWVIL